MGVERALSADEVYLIADPPVTSKQIAESPLPSLKVDLKARLAIELNKRILLSSGSRRMELKKQYKNLMMDVTSVKQEKKLLQDLIDEKERIPYVNRNDSLERSLRDKQNAISEYNKQYTDLQELDRNAANDTERINIRGKMFAIIRAAVSERDKFEELEAELLKLQSDYKILQRTQNEQPAVDEKLQKLNESILVVSDEQKKLENEQKLELDSNINPASFTKSLGERIGEANSLIQSIFNQGTNPHITIGFEEIKDKDDVNQLFIEDGTGRVSNMVLIIYRSQADFGHWCCLTRSNDLRVLNYFNSYGSYVDEAIKYIPDGFRIQTFQDFPHLLKLLSECNYRVEYNDVQLQVMDGKSASCGRWCGMFMRCCRLGKTMQEFLQPFEALPLEDRDKMIVRLTNPYLNET